MTDAPRGGGARRDCVLILFPDGYVGVAPTIRNLAELLAEAGLSIEIVGWRSEFPAATRLDPHIKVRSYRRPTATLVGRAFAAALRRIGLESVAVTVDLAWFLVRTMPVVFRLRRSNRWGSTIGVDAVGSIVASVVSARAHRSFAYLSLELPTGDRHDPFSRLLRRLHGAALRRANQLIVQDADRLASLVRHLGVSAPRAFFLPNAPRGSKSSKTNDFLRTRMSIPEQTFPTIVLHAGMIEDATFSRELVSGFAHVDRGCALVLHDRASRSTQEPYIKELRRLNRTNLFLSLDPVDIDDLDDVYASATIGIAFYRDVDANFGQIAKASGKLAYYLKHGLPIIVNDIPSLRTFVETHDVGVVVRDPGDPVELTGAVDAILGDLDRYSANARRTFATDLDFDLISRPLVEGFVARHSPESDQPSSTSGT